MTLFLSRLSVFLVNKSNVTSLQNSNTWESQTHLQPALTDRGQVIAALLLAHRRNNVPAMCWHQNDAVDYYNSNAGFLSMLLVCLYMLTFKYSTFCLLYFILLAYFDPTCLPLFDNETLTVIGWYENLLMLIRFTVGEVHLLIINLLSLCVRPARPLVPESTMHAPNLDPSLWQRVNWSFIAPTPLPSFSTAVS